MKAFRCWGISVKVGGTEDEICCIKAGGIAAEAFAEISMRTAALLATDESDSESDDPFEDIDEDDGELENEAVIKDDAAEEDNPQVESDNS